MERYLGRVVIGVCCFGAGFLISIIMAMLVGPSLTDLKTELANLEKEKAVLNRSNAILRDEKRLLQEEVEYLKNGASSFETTRLRLIKEVSDLKKKIGESKQLPESAPQVSSPIDERAVIEKFGVRMEVTKVVVGKIQLEDFSGTGESTKPYLSIWLAITNKTQTKKVDFVSWHANQFVVKDATLKDNFENTYRAISAGFGDDIVGSTDSGSIRPGETLATCLVYEIPLNNIRSLTLTLEGSAVDTVGEFEFTIPKDAIEGMD